MIFDYFQKVRPELCFSYSSTGLFCETTYKISEYGIMPCSPRIVRINSTRPLTADGYILAPIGAMGSAIAQTENLPGGIVLIPQLGD